MLTSEQLDLVASVKQFIKRRFIAGQHHVACVLLCGTHKYFALHLDTSGFDVCAEPIAISNALISREASFTAIVAAAWDGDPKKEPWIVSPCGDCRQLLMDYAREVTVIVDGASDDTVGLRAVSVDELLPFPYRKGARSASRHKNILSRAWKRDRAM